jgi:hypothetical protein
MLFLIQGVATTIPVGLMKSFLDGKTLLTDNDAFDPTDIVCELVKSDGTSTTLTLTKTGDTNNINLTGQGLASFVLTAANLDTTGFLRLSFTNAIKEGTLTDKILPFIEDVIVVSEGNGYKISGEVVSVPEFNGNMRDWSRDLKIFLEQILRDHNADIRSLYG